MHGQVHRVVCQLPLQHTLLPAVVPDPAPYGNAQLNSLPHVH